MFILSNNFHNSSYFQFLQQEKQEIEKLKWIESEKNGRDIGKDKAVFLWNRNHRTKWLDGLLKR
jgi:predicted Fe-Mo cluster-binding NifX family protein